MRLTNDQDPRVPAGFTLIGIHKKSPPEDIALLREHLRNPQYKVNGTPVICLDFETHPIDEYYKRQIMEDYTQVEYAQKKAEYDAGTRKVSPKGLPSNKKYPIDHLGGIIAGVSICTQKGVGFYINLAHTPDATDSTPAFTTQDYAGRERAGRFLQALFAECPEGTRFVAHNANFEYRTIMAQGWEWMLEGGTRYNPKIHCTLQMARLLDFEKNGLKYLVSTLFKFEQPEYMQFVHSAHFLPGFVEQYAPSVGTTVATNMGNMLIKNYKDLATVKFNNNADQVVCEALADAGCGTVREIRKEIVTRIKAANEKFGAGYATLEQTLFYAGQDSVWGMLLFLQLEKMLKEQSLWDYYVHVESPILPMVPRMAHLGFAVNHDRLIGPNSLRAECQMEFERLREELPDLLIEEVVQRFPALEHVHWKEPADKAELQAYLNHQARELWRGQENGFKGTIIPQVSSNLANLKTYIRDNMDFKRPADQRDALWSILGFPILTVTDKGNPSFDKEAAARYEPHSTFASALSELKLVLQTASLYAWPYPRLVHPLSGRIHGNLNQSGTETGRFSASDPNFQQMSKRAASELGQRLGVRDVIIADSEDRVLLAPDLSQVELRLIAHYSGDETMQSAYKGVNGEFIDIHEMTCRGIFGKMYQDIEDPKARQVAHKYYRSISKNVNFLVAYLGQGSTLLSNLRKAGIHDKTKEDCDEIIEGFYKIYPGVRRSNEEYIRFDAAPYGQAKTFWGRIRYIEELRRGKRRGERQAVNHRIQGTAADVMKIVMARLFWCDAFKALGAVVLMSIHDELVISVPKKNLLKVVPIIEQAFTDFGFSVPLETSMGAGSNFKQLTELATLSSSELDYGAMELWGSKFGCTDTRPEKLQKNYFGDSTWVYSGVYHIPGSANGQ